MSDQNKATLEQANAAIRAGDHEDFLFHCQEDLATSAPFSASAKAIAGRIPIMKLRHPMPIAW